MQTANKCELENEQTIVTRKDGIEYLQFKRLLEYDEIVHCFTLKPLDLGNKIIYEKKKDMITANYMKLCKSLDLKYEDIVRPGQSHTDNVKVVDDETGIYIPKYKDIDSLITNRKNKILCLCYADCTPLYFYDPVKRAIANAHSGWRGTVQRIGPKTVNMMVKEYGCDPKNIVCVIGPAIGKCHFEIEDDVKQIFWNNFKEIDMEKYLKSSETNDNKYHLDMASIHVQMLKNAGLREENIVRSNICTMCNSEHIYSRRADKQGTEGNMALISIK